MKKKRKDMCDNCVFGAVWGGGGWVKIRFSHSSRRVRLMLFVVHGLTVFVPGIF